MAKAGQVIVLLGAESTGKSQLAQALCRALQADGHDAVVVPEYLRTFCDLHGRTPYAGEQPGIAEMQTRHIEQAARSHAIAVADTSALMTAVYSARLFGDTQLYPSASAMQRGYAATLLTALDLPWVADGHQRDGPRQRQTIDDDVRAALIGHGLPFSVVHGSGEARLAAALAAVRRVLQPFDGDATRERWRWTCRQCDGAPGIPNGR